MKSEVSKELANALDSFTRAAQDLKFAWDDYMHIHKDAVTCEKYPFHKSFDELAKDISQWENEVSNGLVIEDFKRRFSKGDTYNCMCEKDYEVFERGWFLEFKMNDEGDIVVLNELENGTPSPSLMQIDEFLEHFIPVSEEIYELYMQANNDLNFEASDDIVRLARKMYKD